MAKPVTAKLDADQVDHLKEVVDRGEAGSISEAVRMEIGRGTTTNTTLRRMLVRFADSFGLLGMFWLGLTFLYPLEFRALAIPILCISLALYATERALAIYEPEVSRRLVGLFRGDTA